MKIVNPKVISTRAINTDAVYKFIELCGRTCYKSSPNDKITSEKFIRNLIKLGHESVLEHYSVSFIITCDRGVSHELVRHRLASYSQESTRYCNYGGKDIEFIKPKDIEDGSVEYEIWKLQCERCELAYNNLIKAGAKPETARSVLPNSLKTEIVMTANLREWRHFLKLRSEGITGKPHPDMKEIADMILKIFQQTLPVIVEDIGVSNKSSDTPNNPPFHNSEIKFSVWSGDGEDIFEVINSCFKEVFNADDNSLHK